MQVKGSRWARSQVTFGPVGRVVASLLLLLPLWFFLAYAGLFGVVGLVVWGGVVVPWGLRDVWRPVPRPATDEELLQHRLREELARDRAAARPEDPGPAPPTRW